MKKYYCENIYQSKDNNEKKREFNRRIALLATRVVKLKEFAYFHGEKR